MLFQYLNERIVFEKKLLFLLLKKLELDDLLKNTSLENLQGRDDPNYHYTSELGKSPNTDNKEILQITGQVKIDEDKTDKFLIRTLSSFEEFFGRSGIRNKISTYFSTSLNTSNDITELIKPEEIKIESFRLAIEKLKPGLFGGFLGGMPSVAEYLRIEIFDNKLIIEVLAEKDITGNEYYLAVRDVVGEFFGDKEVEDFR